jgi:anti-sigma factor RsiW
MNCPDPQTISEFSDGELEPNQAAEIERHIAQCASCRESLKEMQWLEQRGRGALESIPLEDTFSQKIVPLKPSRLRWVGSMPLTAAAAAVVAVVVGVWLFFNQTASTMRKDAGANISSEQSEDAAFAQWIEPYRNLNIPLVPMEVAANYNPAPIFPTRPDNVERN